MPDLPPIGSLWLHRETGERRFVVLHSHLSDLTYVGYMLTGRVTYSLARPDLWLAWAADAERIDRAEA